MLHYFVSLFPICLWNDKVSQLAILYARKFNVTIIDAIRAIYKSNAYKELEDEETKLWHYGPVALLEYISEHH